MTGIPLHRIHFKRISPKGFGAQATVRPALVSIGKPPLHRIHFKRVSPKGFGGDRKAPASAHASLVHFTVSGKVRESHPVPMAYRRFRPYVACFHADAPAIHLSPLLYENRGFPSTKAPARHRSVISLKSSSMPASPGPEGIPPSGGPARRPGRRCGIHCSPGTAAPLPGRTDARFHTAPWP